MAREPLMDGKSTPNVFDEHVFKIRATFGATSTVTYRSKDASIAKTTTTTFTVTLPKPYAEITDFSYAWFAATAVAPLAVKIITNSVATDGTLVLETEATNTAGTPTAPASGNVLYLTLGVSCATLNDKFTG
jgi:hypothetical protein